MQGTERPERPERSQEGAGERRRSLLRRPANKIILDSYIASKYRKGQTESVQERIEDLNDTPPTPTEPKEPKERRILIRDGLNEQYYWLCPISDCNRIFIERSAAQSHIQSHFSFKCKIEQCEQKFISEQQLAEHQLRPHRTEENFNRGTRQIIDEALAAVGITDDNIPTTHIGGERHLKCPHDGCKSYFKTPYLMKNHLMVHYDIKPFKCPQSGCKWAFRTPAKLKCHTACHERNQNVGPHACYQPHRNKAAATTEEQMLHDKNHEIEQTPQSDCPAMYCTRSFTMQSDLEAHLKTDHNLNQAPHKCPLCERRFWWISSMVTHARAHIETDPSVPRTKGSNNECPWPRCGRQFKLPCHLQYHLRIHTGERPYRCDFPSCNQAFTSSGKLRRHSTKHANDKKRRYSCKVCEQAFFRPEHLREHIARYCNKLRELQCDYPGCEQIFSNKNLIYLHKKRDHPEKVEEVSQQNIIDDLSITQSIEDDPISLRSARTHVPWTPDARVYPIFNINTSLLQHHNSCDEKQGNPLVCGGLALEGESSVANSELTIEADSRSVTSLSELSSDILGSTNDLLLQDLSEGMLYPSDEDTALQVLLTE